MICKKIAFLAGDSDGLEAWRQLTETYEPKVRKRFARQLMSILSFSLQSDTAERITAWEREKATNVRDSGKVWDDEVKIGTFLLRLPESQLITHLLMRVDTLKKLTDFSCEVVAISRAISAAQTQPTPMDIGVMGKGTSSKGGKGAKSGGGNVTIKRSKHLQDAETRIAENVARSVIWQVHVDLLGLRSPRPREVARV